MREILFMGKRVDNGKWVYGDLRQYRLGDVAIWDYKIARMFSVMLHTVGQYTGLTDKNGRKIFEGDIVRQDYSKTINTRYDHDTLGFIDSESIDGHHIGVVKISPQKGVGMRNPMSYNYSDDTKRKVKYFVNVCCYRCEVIGNIHDNPELLEG